MLRLGGHKHVCIRKMIAEHSSRSFYKYVKPEIEEKCKTFQPMINEFLHFKYRYLYLIDVANSDLQLFKIPAITSFLKNNSVQRLAVDVESLC